MKIETTIFILVSLLGSLYAVPIGKSNRTQEGTLGEARLILPQMDNDGLPLVPVRDALELRLLTSFGGFTQLEGVGGWESDGSGGGRELHHEAVWVYDIATTNDATAEILLKDIALWLKKQARQHSVYLRLPSGEIVFV